MIIKQSVLACVQELVHARKLRVHACVKIHVYHQAHGCDCDHAECGAVNSQQQTTALLKDFCSIGRSRTFLFAISPSKVWHLLRFSDQLRYSWHSIASQNFRRFWSRNFEKMTFENFKKFRWKLIISKTVIVNVTKFGGFFLILYALCSK